MAISFEINLFAVLISAIASMVIGFLWYGPIFGKQWIKLMKFGNKEISKAKKKGMIKYYVANFIATLITAFVLAVFISATGTDSWLEGANIGFWVWLGFLAPVMLGSVIWEGRTVKLYALNVAYWFVNLIVIGVIIGVWN